MVRLRVKRLNKKRGMTAIQAAILTAIGIAVAFIVGYWIWTVVVGSIHTEKLSLTLPSATYNDTVTLLGGNKGWIVKLTIKNSGPSDATIVDVRINGKSYKDWGSAVAVDLNNDGSADDPATNGFTLKSGDETSAVIALALGAFKHGQTVEISFVTASNQVYTSSVSLP